METYTCLDCHCRERKVLTAGPSRAVTEDAVVGTGGSQTVWPHTRKSQVLGEPDTGGNEQKHPNMG